MLHENTATSIKTEKHLSIVYECDTLWIEVNKKENKSVFYEWKSIVLNF